MTKSGFITSAKEVMFSLLFDCLMKFSGKVSSGPNEQLIKCWWQSRSLAGYRDCFLDSSLLGDMESG